MISLKSNSIVYIACPANINTGGPELLHQLAFNLRKGHIDARMFYLEKVIGQDPVHESYKVYSIPLADKIEDDKKNLLILPEAYYQEVFNYHYINKALWWLSVGFFREKFSKFRGNCFFIRALNYTINKLRSIKVIDQLCLAYERLQIEKEFTAFNRLDNLIHFAQCHYIADFLSLNGIKATYLLSDYLREDFLIENQGFSIKERENIVLYNPKKGIKFTHKIMHKAKGIKFEPLINLSPTQIVDKMKRAKVYIDFGNHPGKDRMPREAAILGCCVITNTQGSAGYIDDVPIKKEYKFMHLDDQIPNIVNKIRDCLEHYEENIIKFDSYRKVIRLEKLAFIQAINHLFSLKVPLPETFK